MAATFTIPTYFTAIDKFSSVVNRMGSNVESFASKSEIAIARSERAFRKFTPHVSSLAKEMLSMASIATVGAGVIMAGKSVMDYETSIANLSAITGTSGTDLDKFKSKIKEVATETKESSIQVANAFTAIGNNQPQLLKDSEGMAAVTKASLILARASKMELAPAAESLTSIMNQYSIGAMMAGKTTDQLAAAAQSGSMEIIDTAEALKKFAPVAVIAGIKINESLALLQTGSKFFKEGSESGTKFLNIITVMASMKVQDPKALHDLKRLGVNMDIVTSKTIPFGDRLNELKKIGNDVPALFHVFGKENLAMAASVLNSTYAYGKLLPKIDAVGVAQEMAAKNNATFTRSIGQLKDKFITWITTSDQAAKSLDFLRKGAIFLADNLSTIVTVGGYVIGFMASWWLWTTGMKAAMLLLRGATLLTQVVTQAFFLVDIIKYTASTQGITFATAAWRIAQESVNAAMYANPIGIVIAAVMILIAGLMKLQDQLDKTYKLISDNAVNKADERFRKELESVNKLSGSYQKLGLSKEDANKKAGFSAISIIDKNIEKITPLAKQGNVGAVSALSEMESQRSAIFKNYIETPANSATLLNPGAAQTQNLAQTITNNNNTQKEVIVTVKAADGTSAQVLDNGSSSVIPSMGSTMQ